MLYSRPVILVRLLAGLVQSNKRGRDLAHVRGDNLRWKTVALLGNELPSTDRTCWVVFFANTLRWPVLKSPGNPRSEAGIRHKARHGLFDEKVKESVILPWHRRSSYEPDAPARGVPQSPRWRVGLVCARMRNFLAGVICCRNSTP